MIKERPIIMSGDHPKLILDGLKIMTRRVIVPQPTKGAWNATAEHPSYGWFWKGLYQDWEGEDDFFKRLAKHCPYGQVGDLLWVRETWGYHGDSADFGRNKFVKWVTYGSDATQIAIEFNSFDAMISVPPHQNLKYPQDYDELTDIDQTDIKTDLLHKWWEAKKKLPSLFMPRWASRILLEITEIRAERLWGITGEDCIAEGIRLPERIFGDGDSEYFEMIEKKHIRLFSSLWDSLNAKRGYGWDKNLWVFPISFRLVDR